MILEYTDITANFIRYVYDIIGKITDRHDFALGVVALVPTFLDGGSILGALASESVTTPGHVPNLKQDSHHTPSLPKKKGSSCNACRGSPVSSARALTNSIESIFHLQMSESIETSEGNVENEERTAKVNAHLQSLFGAQFQVLFLENFMKSFRILLFSAT